MDKERFLEIVCFVHAFIAAVFGIIFIFFTEGFLEIIAWPATDVTMGRLLGAALIGFGFSSIIAWKRVDWEKLQIVVEMEIVWITIAIVIFILGAFTPGYPLIIWLFIIMFIVFDVAFMYTYYLFRE